MKTLDKEVADIQAAIAAATTLEELVQIEERVRRIGTVSTSLTYLLVRGQLLKCVETRVSTLLDGRSGS